MGRRPSLAAAGSAVIAVVGTLGLLGVSVALKPHEASGPAPYFLAQAAGLVLALGAIAAARVVAGRRLRFLRPGDLRAGARRVAALGIGEGESWLRVGASFAVVVSAVTAAFLWFAPATQLREVTPRAWGFALLLAIPLSVTNAITEEAICRLTIAEGFADDDRLSRLAPWASALIFGGVHYFGIPGGPIGSVMAGFLAWLLTRSIQDTRGLGWAWFIHFLQDVLIFTVMATRFWT